MDANEELRAVVASSVEVIRKFLAAEEATIKFGRKNGEGPWFVLFCFDDGTEFVSDNGYDTIEAAQAALTIWCEKIGAQQHKVQ